MSLSPSLSNYLSGQKIQYDILEHSHTSSSMATARAADIEPAEIAKAVIVRYGSHYTMCVLPASHQLILEWLEYEQQLPYELAGEDELGSLFPDCEPGAVPGMGQAYHMDVILDVALLDKKDIYIEGGDHQHLVHMSRNDFQVLMENAWQAVISCPISDEFEDTIH